MLSEVTVAGIEMFLRDEQLLNALSLIVVSPLGKKPAFLALLVETSFEQP